MIADQNVKSNFKNEEKKLQALSNIEAGDNNINIELKKDLNNIIKKDMSEIETSEYIYNQKINMYEDMAQTEAAA